uniref:Galactosylgalactosylxylosylprotein 3-beta-glucuronosyltransferase n=1 Tax=Plectus sambesii TaxID=2011161 RepID=A0A914XPB5_9BILA
AEIHAKERRLDEASRLLRTKERDLYRLEKRVVQLEEKLRDRLSLVEDRSDLPMIYFITPTHYRPEQRAELTRLSNTLRQVPNLFWILVEDAEKRSPGVAEVLARSKLQHAHIFSLTPADKKLTDKDKNWKLPRGVEQRNAALTWIRTNLAGIQKGVIYFGDDDNSYDLRLFDEIRAVKKVGVWPVGIVGSLLVETPVIGAEGKLTGFNSIWKPERPFPIDMAAFAVNLQLILAHEDVAFTYEVPRGYQESHLLSGLGISASDLEPMADHCSKVYVWHTRTEKSKLTATEREKFKSSNLLAVERDSVGAV